MKISVKCIDEFVSSHFSNVNGNYDLYVNKNGFPVIEIMNEEIPVITTDLIQHQTITFKPDDTGGLNHAIDRYGFLNVLLELSLPEKSVKFINDTNKKRIEEKAKLLKEEKETKKLEKENSSEEN